MPRNVCQEASTAAEKLAIVSDSKATYLKTL